MRVGVGLPNGIPGTQEHLIIEWARRAVAGPFTSLGVVDRLIYDSYEPLTTLAAAAAVTSRVRLATTIVIGPLHNDTLLAKVTASLDALSGGRLVLGLAVGARKEDYDAAGYGYMKDYYAFTGPFAEKIAAGLLTSPQAIAQFTRGYAEAGCDELVLFPAVSDIAQLDQLAAVLDGLGRYSIDPGRLQEV